MYMYINIINTVQPCVKGVHVCKVQKICTMMNCHKNKFQTERLLVYCFCIYYHHNHDAVSKLLYTVDAGVFLFAMSIDMKPRLVRPLHLTARTVTSGYLHVGFVWSCSGSIFRSPRMALLCGCHFSKHQLIRFWTRRYMSSINVPYVLFKNWHRMRYGCRKLRLLWRIELTVPLLICWFLWISLLVKRPHCWIDPMCKTKSTVS